MRSKKGFTLIELLAVIVILAVIALIATPIIMNVIHDSKEGAAKDAMYGYVKAVELASAKQISPTTDAPNGTYTTENGNLKQGSEVLEITFKGTKPANNGTVTLSKGNVTSATLIFDNITVTYNGKKAEVGGGNTPSPTPIPTVDPSSPYAPYAYDPDLINALENGTVSIAPESNFTLSNGIVSYTNSAAGILVVPSKIGGQPVTQINISSFPVGLQGLHLPNTVTKIETYSFNRHSALTELILPPSITKIENWVFDGATSLKYIKFTGSTPPAINEGANGTFRDMTLSENKIYVPSASLSAYQSAFGPSLPSSIQIVGY